MPPSDAFAPEGLFEILHAPALAALPRMHVERGSVLIAEGSTASEMFLVETGRFRVERGGVNLDEIGAGGVVGEIAFFTGGTRTADVVAVRDSIVCRLSQDDYRALCEAHPDLPQAITSELAKRLARTSRRVPPDPGRPPARTFALLPAANAPLPVGFADDLAQRMGRHHRTLVITEDRFRAACGPAADPASPDAVAWLNAQEKAADLVLFVAAPQASDWSRAALRQADQVVFIAQSVRFAPPSELERFAMDIAPKAQCRLVLLHPHRMHRVTGTDRWLDSRPVFLHHHVAVSPDGADLDRLARFLAGEAIGLVLSGGGAFGVAHVGVWRAMTEAGLNVDIAGGTSIGSAMAAAVALAIPPDEIGPRVEEIFVRSGAMRRVTVPRYAFLDHKTLDAALIEHYGTGLIEDLWMPYFAVAADLSTMQKVVLRRGPLWEAIRASSAIPGVLPALFTSGGGMLVDGGCIDNMPVRDMHGLKRGPNIVVNVQKETGRAVHVDYATLPGRAELLRRTVVPFQKSAPRAPGVISTVMRSLLVGQADALSHLNADDLYIRAPGLKGAGFLAWSKHRLFYELGYKHAVDVFGDLRRSDDPAKQALARAACDP